MDFLGSDCFDKVRKIAEERCTGRSEEEVQEDIRTSVREVARMLIQPIPGVKLRKRQDHRFIGGHKAEIERVLSEGKRPLGIHAWIGEDETKYAELNTKTLLREEQANVLTLAGLKIFPKMGEQGGETETIVGTLEVHRNGFYYATSSPSYCFSFFYLDVKTYLFRVGDEKMPPLLHFHLHKGIKVGTEKRRDIQFRLVQMQSTPVGRKRSYNDDSDKINQDLKNFVDNVQEKWRDVSVGHYKPFVDAEVCRGNGFQGNRPSKAPTIFGLTLFTLVGLVDEPFTVVNLSDIDVVHLRLKPELSKPVEIDMTIVFNDLERDPVQINSIPIDKLNFLKNKCYLMGPKYYVNDYEIDWGSIVKEMADSPPLMVEKHETMNYYNAGRRIVYRDGSGGERKIRYKSYAPWKG